LYNKRVLRSGQDDKFGNLRGALTTSTAVAAIPLSLHPRRAASTELFLALTALLAAFALLLLALALEVAGLQWLIAAIARTLPLLLVALTVADGLRRIGFVAPCERCARLALAHDWRSATATLLSAIATLVRVFLKVRAAIAALRLPIALLLLL